MRVGSALAVAAALAAPVLADDLTNIKHIVLFMQENRAFDHYFGTMAGVRGFQDPNAHISNNTGKDVFHQPVNKTMDLKVSGAAPVDYSPPSNVSELLPWYLPHQGGDWSDRVQCMLAGSNSWQQNHAAWNEGNIDRWAMNNTPYSLGYLKRADIPVHFALAENFVVADAYHEAQIASTDPNRVTWFSTSINANGSSVGGDTSKGGTVLENNRDPYCLIGADGAKYSCRPLYWKTVPEYLSEANIDWKLYQDYDNFGDNTLVEWRQYQLAAKNKTDLARRALSYDGIQSFYKDAKEGTLPEVSYIVGPQYLSEHPPYTPQDGAWFQRNVANAVMNGKNWNETALIIMYDETGGWADHVMAPHASKGTPGEWIQDPFTKEGKDAPTGPGFRLPFYIISPYTRNGGVFTEVSSHESQTLFLEKWAKAIGKPFHVNEMNKWRREQLSDLVKAFDFSKKNTSVPSLPEVPEAKKDPITGTFNGAWDCLLRFKGDVQPEIPYGQQNETDALSTEKGVKMTRGDLTEGRYLSFIAWNKRVAVSDNKLSSVDDRGDFSNEQLFVIHWLGSVPKDNVYTMSTADKKQFLTKDLNLTDNQDKAAKFALWDNGNGQGYTIQELDSKKYFDLSQDGTVSMKDNDAAKFAVASVSL
ncbi:phospholipase C [Malassezia pachydermatis]|uniref:Putative phospholipase c n=1 Tax=Malassezia pachydermatis TaxID=77020 RepID=A0A0M8MVC3_9BASI|nr:putative phospholipase c [Malassezia pachydermatis]KOS14331.1 putative phospholipase c [Malassezia pachydermatis]